MNQKQPGVVTVTKNDWLGTLSIGHQGEYGAERRAFDVAYWRERYGDGVTWAISASDTARPGYGSFELHYSVGEDVLAKSCAGATFVADALGEAGDVPAPYRAWVDEVTRAGAAAEAAGCAEAAAIRQPVVGENGSWWAWDAEKGGYADTGQPARGEGVPPGGTAGQVLAKRSGEDGDSGWRNLLVYEGVYGVTPLIGAATTMNTQRTYAFTYCCAARSVTIPANVTSIGQQAFRYGYLMKELHVKPGSPPALGANAITGASSDRVIYVPSGSRSAYQSATNWSAYASSMAEE